MHVGWQVAFLFFVFVFKKIGFVHKSALYSLESALCIPCSRNASTLIGKLIWFIIFKKILIKECQPTFFMGVALANFCFCFT
jgi:hypothetical protein